MKKVNDKYIIILLMITLLSLTYGIKYISKSKYEELPEVKLKEKSDKNKSFAIMVQNEDGDGYSKYQENSWPSSGYKFKEAKCVDNNGNLVNDVVSFESGKVTIKTDRTIYCTLYFDVLFNGKGTKENPYKINYIEDLVDLQIAVNNGETYIGKYFTLEKSLDFNEESDYQNYQSEEYGDINGVDGIEGIKEELTNTEGRGFIPIGFDKLQDTKIYFSGIFNGNNNSINNLYIKELSAEQSAIGLFGIVVNGTLKNLTISGSLYVEYQNNIGAFVGYLNGGTIENCVNEATVKSNADSWGVGGFVGSSNNTIVLKNLTNRGQINNGGSIGGIMGGNDGGSLKIENCYNYGTIEGRSFNDISGIIGISRCNSKIDNSVNYGEIKANNTGNVEIFAGGIMGSATKELEITNSHNEGIIDIKGTLTIEIGGIIGKSQSKVIITNCYNLKEINSVTSGNNMNLVGGILGYLTYSDIEEISKIENSYNKGNINGGNRSGGILGNISGNSKLIINRCYNIGTIIGQIDTNFSSGVLVGGVVSQVWNGSTIYILNSYNSGELIANAEKTFGHAGGVSYAFEDANTKSKGYIINSYNKGKITAQTSASGVGGINDNSIISLNNVYNIGEINAPSQAEIIFVRKNGEIKSVDNAYYKEGLSSCNKSLTGFYSMTDVNIKNANTQDSNSLIYKLNQNIININQNGLSSLDKTTIGADLDGYTLVDWIIDPITEYPTLNYTLESN